MFDYPSGFLPRQKATSPYKGRRGCAANPEDRGRCGANPKDRGRCGAMGEDAGGRLPPLRLRTRGIRVGAVQGREVCHWLSCRPAWKSQVFGQQKRLPPKNGSLFIFSAFPGKLTLLPPGSCQTPPYRRFRESGGLPCRPQTERRSWIRFPPGNQPQPEAFPHFPSGSGRTWRRPGR